MRLKNSRLLNVVLGFTLALVAMNPALASYQEPPVRVALIAKAQSAKVSTSDGMELRELRNGVLLKAFDGASSVTFTKSGDKVKASTGQESPDFIINPKGGTLTVGEKEYRGSMQVSIYEGGICVIDVLPMEVYLRGVVASEMPASWEMEALKAQAVAARTYALNRLGQFGDAPYDVLATVDDQVYGGISWEDDRTDKAIEDTRGMVMTYDGKPIIAYFSSSAGGCTNDPADYSGTAVPYLKSVISPDEDSNRWSIDVTKDELVKITKSSGTDIGTLKDVRISEYSPSGRVVSIEVIGSKGSVKISANSLRQQLGYSRMKSTRFIFGDGPDLLPILINPTKEAMKMVREILARVIMMYGAGEIAVRGDALSESIILASAIAIGVGGKSDLGDETYVLGYETSETGDMVPQVGAGSNVDVLKFLKPVTVGDSITISGSGYGHGKGMSQYGAQAFAKQGWNFRQILEHYYTDADLVEYYE